MTTPWSSNTPRRWLRWTASGWLPSRPVRHPTARRGACRHSPDPTRHRCDLQCAATADVPAGLALLARRVQHLQVAVRNRLVSPVCAPVIENRPIADSIRPQNIQHAVASDHVAPAFCPIDAASVPLPMIVPLLIIFSPAFAVFGSSAVWNVPPFRAIVPLFCGAV